MWWSEEKSMLRLTNLIILILFLLTGCLDVSNPQETQLAKELKAIDDYLQTATFKHITDGNNSGIRIGVTQFGSGPPPHEGQIVNVTFTGHLLSDWSVFETVTFNDKVEAIPVIGLQYGIESLPEGSIATVFIASQQAFGPVGSSKVPGNATIAYEVNLSKVTKTAAELTQFKADTTLIHKFIMDSSIVATQNANGIWYTIDNSGTGKSPDVYNLVTFHYRGTILSSGKLFQEGDISKQIVFGLIDGLKIGFPLMKVGNTATFYIPSGLGYGPAGTNVIAPNENLKFVIKLTAVE